MARDPQPQRARHRPRDPQLAPSQPPKPRPTRTRSQDLGPHRTPATRPGTETPMMHRRPVAAQKSWFTPDDLHWFNEGSHHRLYGKLGGHVTKDKPGHFAV